MWRIVFGLLCTIDATFKWQPAFQTGSVSYLMGGLKGQPALVKAWFWIDIVKVDGGLKDDAKRANLIAYLATLK